MFSTIAACQPSAVSDSGNSATGGGANAINTGTAQPASDAIGSATISSSVAAGVIATVVVVVAIVVIRRRRRSRPTQFSMSTMATASTNGHPSGHPSLELETQDVSALPDDVQMFEAFDSQGPRAASALVPRRRSFSAAGSPPSDRSASNVHAITNEISTNTAVRRCNSGIPMSRLAIPENKGNAEDDPPLTGRTTGRREDPAVAL